MFLFLFFCCNSFIALFLERATWNMFEMHEYRAERLFEPCHSRIIYDHIGWTASCMLQVPMPCASKPSKNRTPICHAMLLIHTKPRLHSPPASSSLDQYTSFAKEPWGFNRPENRKKSNFLSKATFVEWPNTTCDFSLRRGVAPPGKLANQKERRPWHDNRASSRNGSAGGTACISSGDGGAAVVSVGDGYI